MHWLTSSPLTMGVSSWLLTYALHSTLLLGTAWLAGRALGQRQLALQELVWRAALVGALVTATVPSLVGGGRVPGALAALHAREAVPTATSPAAPAAAPLPALAAERGETTVSPTRSAAVDLSPRWGMALTLVWLLGAAIALGRLVRARSDLGKLLRGRRRLALPSSVARLARVMGVRRVALSASEAIAAPFATGLVRSEICCPERMLRDLVPAHRDGVLAHELAHVARRDPAWRLLYRLTSGVLFFQPLNRVGRRRLEELSELASDDLAVRCTGNRIGLAHSLLEVAAWSGSGRAPVPAVAAVSRPATLARRVEKLLADARDSARPGWAAPAALAVVATCALVLPSVTVRAAVAGVGPGSELPPAVAAPAPAPHPEPAPAPSSPAPMTPPAAPAPPAAAAPPSPPAPPEEVTDAQLGAMDEQLQRQLEQLLARERELNERMGPTEEQLRAIDERIRELSEAMLPTEEEIRAIEERARDLAEKLQPSEEDIHRLQEQAAAAAEGKRLSAAQREELRARAREMAERLRPSQEEIRRLADEARAMAERMRPSQEEIQRLADEARRLALETAPSREEIERMTAEIRAQARKLAEEARRLADEQRQHAADHDPR